jgi:hypothetical protein
MRPIAPCTAPCTAPAKKLIAGRGWWAAGLGFGCFGWVAEALWWAAELGFGCSGWAAEALWWAAGLGFGWSGSVAKTSVLVVVRTTHTWSSRSPAMRLR